MGAMYFENMEMLILKRYMQSSGHSTVEMSPPRNDELADSIPGLEQWVKDPVLP